MPVGDDGSLGDLFPQPVAIQSYRSRQATHRPCPIDLIPTPKLLGERDAPIRSPTLLHQLSRHLTASRRPEPLGSEPLGNDRIRVALRAQREHPCDQLLVVLKLPTTMLRWSNRHDRGGAADP